MSIFILIALALLLWILLGCFVLSQLDNDGRLLEWLKECPMPGAATLAVILWPMLAFLVLRARKEQP